MGDAHDPNNGVPKKVRRANAWMQLVVPPDLSADILRMADRSGETATTIVRHAIESYLGEVRFRRGERH